MSDDFNARLLRFQRLEVAELERSVRVYSEILADYEARLAEARRALAKLEERERSS